MSKAGERKHTIESKKRRLSQQEHLSGLKCVLCVVISEEHMEIWHVVGSEPEEPQISDCVLH